MILGLDVSTSITGATVIDHNGKMVYNEYWDTRNKNKYPTLYDKASLLRQKLLEINKAYKIKNVFIEQSLQSFRSGFSSAKTLSTLSRFNGIVSWLCYDTFEIKANMLAATSARKLVGLTIKRGENAKQKVFDFVVAQEPSFVVDYTSHGNLKPGIFDKSDSYVIAKAGYNAGIRKK